MAGSYAKTAYVRSLNQAASATEMARLTNTRLLALCSLLLFLTPASSGTFYSQLRRCPQTCSAAGPSPTNWTTYHGFDRLGWCNDTTVFEFNIFNGLKTLGTIHTTIRACTADDTSSAAQSRRASSGCGSVTTTSSSLQLASWHSTTPTTASSSFISQAGDALRNQLTGASRCGDPAILFARHGEVIIGLYVGSGIDGAAAAHTLISQITSEAETEGPGDAIAAQVCGKSYDMSDTMGLMVSTTGNYPMVQSAVHSWANATCVTGYDSAAASNITVSRVSPSISNTNRIVNRDASLAERGGTCAYAKVASGDSCGSLATKCHIPAADFAKYNPNPDFCSTLVPGQLVCCSSGSLPDLTPKPKGDGTCYGYTVKSGDYCALVARKNYITVSDIEKYNAKTWGWNGCNNLQLGAVICLSTGDPPLPAVVSSAVCGPQVPGTKRPDNWSDIGSLNPCPLNSCVSFMCDIWGQCGITPDFCTPSKSTTGAPGTAAPGTNGCISNCGISITNNDEAPDELKRIGYFEAFGVNRSCLVMDATRLPSSYSHVHFAFAGITKDYQVDISGVQGQLAKFAARTSFKRVVSFGGWSFSTSLDSHPVFRQGVTDANRLTFAKSVVALVNEYSLDGVDFDWEYPGAPDIPGIPAGSPSDGPNYLGFLQTLRSLLPSNKTISMAAPASYWYLKGFPIAKMSEVLDYIVYMTYDLHGQWDYGTAWSTPGCPSGDCLRSHVNLTETEYALAMITKAGVPANKIVVGIASYGRSFGMEDPGCTGPGCRFTGPDSTATPGECTDTAGYISQAELERYMNPKNGTISRRAIAAWHDDSSDSDMMTYGNGTWVAYMSQGTKASRIARYAGCNLAGTVEWAVDLTAFVVALPEAAGSLDFTALEADFTAADGTLMAAESGPSGTCTAYDTEDCSYDRSSNAYYSPQGCHNYKAADQDTKTWAALKCGANSDSLLRMTANGTSRANGGANSTQPGVFATSLFSSMTAGGRGPQ
ncbi:Killer toxin subunits alpha/beta [Tolypocladium ophioglossoides CBS 100239]|uniref:chitinase n=1 Tax=Tolypocladium ophioglossoides (strain CBS 100239) TaxID=1163406 RepID=A0A0L0N221_TOLOC|nr:Killer toxin subunits alpha/beta [Tolypocladium ophioglossoides CBS 100239]